MVEKTLKNGAILDKYYKDDLKKLVHHLQKHADFTDVEEKVNGRDVKVPRIKLMLGPVKDFHRAYEKVDAD